MTLNTTWLRDRLKAREVRHEDLGDALHINRVSATRLLNGRRAIGIEELAPIARLAGCSVAELLEGLGVDLGRASARPFDIDLLQEVLEQMFVKTNARGDLRPDEMARVAAFTYRDAQVVQADQRSAAIDQTADSAIRYERYVSGKHG